MPIMRRAGLPAGLGAGFGAVEEAPAAVLVAAPAWREVVSEGFGGWLDR